MNAWDANQKGESTRPVWAVELRLFPWLPEYGNSTSIPEVARKNCYAIAIKTTGNEEMDEIAMDALVSTVLRFFKEEAEKIPTTAARSSDAAGADSSHQEGG